MRLRDYHRDAAQEGRSRIGIDHSDSELQNARAWLGNNLKFLPKIGVKLLRKIVHQHLLIRSGNRCGVVSPESYRGDHDFAVLAPLRGRINVTEAGLILSPCCE